MPCSICREQGHNKSRCPYKDVRGKYVYQLVCLILTNYETNVRYVHISSYIARILRELSADAFSSLSSYVKNRFHVYYSQAYQYVYSSLLFRGLHDKVKTRFIEEASLGILATHNGFRSIVYAGLPNSDLQYIMNNPFIQSNDFLKRSIWQRSSSFVINNAITFMTFKPMSEAIVARPKEAKIKIGFDECLVIPELEPECPICMEPFTVKTLARLDCGHHVCIDCMKTCEQKTPVHKSVSCCLCRAPVKNMFMPMTTCGECV